MCAEISIPLLGLDLNRLKVRPFVFSYFKDNIRKMSEIVTA